MNSLGLPEHQIVQITLSDLDTRIWNWRQKASEKRRF
jgi:hypothetical protein